MRFFYQTNFQEFRYSPSNDFLWKLSESEYSWAPF